MNRLIASAVIYLTSAAGLWAADIEEIVNDHIIGGYEKLVSASEALAEAASNDCSPTNDALRSAFHAAFDDWIKVSHLRFGPSETNDRAFALAFWPDPRGSTPSTLATLIRNNDTVVDSVDDFSTVSIAARGFYALEFLLYDDQFVNSENTVYLCKLVQAVSKDILQNSSAILADWTNSYGDLLANPSNDTYRTEKEALQQLFTALSTGLEFTSLQRLARPMGTFDRPRPKRAEARRSERSLRNVVLSLAATQDLARHFAGTGSKIDLAFDDAIKTATALNDPIFANVTDISGRIRVESLKLKVDDIRKDLAFEIGESLGIAAGFNALDGD